MMMKSNLVLLASLLSMAPALASPPADNALLGTWDIVEGAAAPWAQARERANLSAAGKRQIKTQVIFGRTEVTSRARALACKDAVYEGTEYSPDAMFRGALLEPNQDSVAHSMGFPPGDVPGIDVTCDNDTFSYHFRDKVTVMVAVDNIIYTLKRDK